jgi:hypothetical protein
LVSGPATNTLGGRDLIEKLCGVKAINIVDPKEWPALQEILFERLELEARLFKIKQDLERFTTGS